MSSMDQPSSVIQYDFPKFVFISRSIQLLTCAIELILLHSESSSMGTFSFLFLSCFMVLNLVHLATRWFYNIDGRYDLQQFIKEPNNENKLQYGIALFFPCVMGFITWRFIRCGNGFGSTLFHGSALIQMLSAFGLLALELYEVYGK